MDTSAPRTAQLSRRSFLAAAGTAAACAAASSVALAAEPPAGDAPGGEEGMSPIVAEAVGEPYSGQDDVARTDAKGNTVYYSMRRNWVEEPPVIDATNIAKTIDTDVAVVGLCVSGSQCFRMAAEKGLSVVGVDKQAKDTFTSFGSQVGHFNSQWQEDVLGIPKDTFDPVDFIDTYQTLSCGRAQPDLIKQWAHRNGEIIDWMLEMYSDPTAVTAIVTPSDDPNYSYKKGNLWTYPAVIALNSGDYDNAGAFCTASVDAGIAASPSSQALYEHTAQVLVRDDDGLVTGVIVQNDEDDSYVQINAKIGVVLAGGDFSANNRMFNALCTEVQETNPYIQPAGTGQDGSSIKMGIWAGGVMEIGPRAAMGGNTAAMPMGFFGASEGLWINKYGKRFCNEAALDFPIISGIQSARQPIGSSIIQVWDAGHWREFVQNQPLGHWAGNNLSDAQMDVYQTKLDEAYAAGADGANGVYAADDLETLAGYLGLEGEAAANFVEAVNTYSTYAENGRDEDYAKSPDLMWPINEGPFYAEKLERNPNLILVTLAGLNVDGNQQVLDQDFEPIAGLYATGNSSGNRFPLQYSACVNGISLGFATVLGALLGEHLATLA